MTKEIIVDDLDSEKPASKKINSKRKGATGERNLCKLLKKHFDLPFNRVVGSGNRWGQVDLTKESILFYTGDVVTPPNFKFIIESKFGYNDKINLEQCILYNKNQFIDEIIKTANSDSSRVNKPHLIFIKKNYEKDYFVFIKTKELNTVINLDNYLVYQDYYCISLTNLFSITNKEFFFN